MEKDYDVWRSKSVGLEEASVHRADSTAVCRLLVIGAGMTMEMLIYYYHCC